jgi:hypothetical protein
MRWEMRVHDFDIPNLGYAYSISVGTINQSGPAVTFGPQVPTWDVVTRGQQVTTNGTDLTIRVQRDVVNSRYTLEACNVATGVCAYDPAFAHINILSNPSFANQQWYIKPGRSVAFIRWYSSVVLLGTPIPLTGVGDIANWDFEGNVVDSVHGLTFRTFGDARVSYVSTPSYAPVCNAGTPQSFRAGYTGTLDGSKSQSLDETGLSLFWQQVSGPSVVTWSSKTDTAPTISGIVAGEYVFQLRVTSGVPRLSGGTTFDRVTSPRHQMSKTCTVTHGAVETDDTGVVVAANATIDTLIGPLIRYGASPWPWFDDRNRAAADVRIAYMDTDYPAYWERENHGIISVVHGTTSVTGVGSNFLTTVCDPTGKAVASIVIQYPHTDGQGVGYLKASVANCVSDTALSLTDVFPVPDAINQHWGDDRGRGWWSYNSAPANYYDNVAAFYQLYYRSGLTAYRTAARKLADRFWRAPELDRGRGPVFGSAMCRAFSPLGLLLRSVDNPPADMTAGLHRQWDAIGLYIGKDTGSPAFDYSWGAGELWDLREVGYHLNHIAYCALVDPDPTYQSKCRRWLGQAISQLFLPRRQEDGSWGGPFGSLTWVGHNSWTTPKSSVKLAQGSAVVTGVGTSWAPGDFPVYIWFTNADPATMPQSRKDGDSVAYRATWNSPTSLTLDRQYEGRTGAHGWQTSPEHVGYGVQPFMEGILSIGFDLAAKALAAHDPTNAARAAQFHLDSVNWLKNYGYNSAIQGMVYYVGPDCSAGYYHPTGCDGGPDYNAEPMLATMRAYGRTRDTAYRDFAAMMFNNYWAKPLTCPTGSAICIPNASYASDWEDSGYRMTATDADSGRGSKWFGSIWGYSSEASIPALRVSPR